ncbi:MAG: hypothetical protein ACR2IP_07185 [Solirubrobacteraceae bacterium]
MADVDRAEALQLAELIGVAKASEQLGVPAATIRSWRHRATGATAAPEATPAVKPGDDAYQCTPVHGGHPASVILEALSVAERRGVDRAASHIGVSPPLVTAWQYRARGEEPPDHSLDYRFSAAWPGLPYDARREIMLDVERRAWRYLEPDLQHLRLVAAREAAARVERDKQQRHERAQVTEQERAEQAAAAKAKQAAHEQAEANRARVRAQREQAAAESERMRRASEDRRRSGSRGGCPPRLPQNRTYAGRIRLFGTAGC